MMPNRTMLCALAWRCGLTVLGLGALLPLFPAWVRAEPPTTEKQLLEARKALEFQLDSLRKATANPEADKARIEMQQLEAVLRMKLNEVHELERRLKEAQERAQQPEKPGVGIRIWQAPGEKQPAVEKGIFYLHDLQIMPATAPQGRLYELIPGEKGTLILRPVASPPQVKKPAQVEKPEGIRFLVKPVVPDAPPPALKKRPEVEERNKSLEKRLDALQRELEQLRKDLKAQPPGATKIPSQPGVIRFQFEPETKQAEAEKRPQEIRLSFELGKERQEKQPKK